MTKFIIDRKERKISSINRTIRLKTEQYDKIMGLSKKTGISFNKIVAQCIDFALENLEEIE